MDYKTLKTLLNTLNRIAVSGEENMNMLLGCIQLLKSEITRAETEEREKNAENRAAD